MSIPSAYESGEVLVGRILEESLHVLLYRTPEEACTQIIHSARRTMPGVLYIPHLCMLWDTISDTVRATLTTLLMDIAPTAPLLILSLSNRPYASLPQEVQV